MTPAKSKLLVCMFPYAGNGGISSVAFPILQWYGNLVKALDAEERIGKWFLHAISDTPITMGRNRAVTAAKKAGCDFLLMVDSDMHPDMYQDAPAFFPTAFDFAYKRKLQGLPTVIGAPYCGPPGQGMDESNTYVFRWYELEEGAQNRTDLRFLSRSEAALMRGIQPMAALPTGLVLYDVAAFDLLNPPYFRYEWRDEQEDEKVSTEDVTNTRDISLAAAARGFGEVCYATMDCWAGHMKVKTMGKPTALSSDAINKNLRDAWVSKETAQDIADHNPPAQPDLPSQTTQGVMVRPRTIFGRKAYSLGHITPVSHLEALAGIVETFAMQNPDRHLRIVEIGSWVGESAVALASGLGQAGGYVYCIDHFQGNSEDHTSEIVERLGRDKIREYWNMNTRGLPIRLMEGSSEDLATTLDRQDIDILWIDGTHTQEGLTQDILLWLQHMRPDGIIIGHDHVPEIPGVEQACKAVFGDAYFQYDECPSIWFARMEDAELWNGDQGAEASAATGDEASA